MRRTLKFSRGPGSGNAAFSIIEILITLGVIAIIGALIAQSVGTGFDSARQDHAKTSLAYAKSFILHQLSCSKTLSSGPCASSQYVDLLTNDGRVLVSSAGSGYPSTNPTATLKVKCNGYELTPEYSDKDHNNSPLFGSNITIPCNPMRVFGIDYNGDIYELDLIAKTMNKVRTNPTILAATSADLTCARVDPNYNSLAYDPAREHLCYLGPSATNHHLYCWSRSTNVLSDVGSIGVPFNPSDADFYDNAFWYFPHRSNILMKLKLTYNSSGLPSGFSPTAYTINGINIVSETATANTFGDIAINKNTGILYAYTAEGRFFSVDLNGDPTNGFTEIKAGAAVSNAGLQLVFDTDNNILYGHRTGTGQWYTINLSNGATTPIGWVTTTPINPANPSAALCGFRDIAGAVWPKWVPN